jgi:hypothetical protein
MAKKKETKPTKKPRIRGERFQWRDDEPIGITIERREEIPPVAGE